MKLLRVFLISVIIISTILSAVACGAFFYLKRSASAKVPTELIEGASGKKETTLYYYKNGDPNDIRVIEGGLSGLSSRYLYTPYSRIPERLVNAFIAIEDKRFFEHNGVDPLRSAAAVAGYIFRRSDTFGASTITQQLVKNLTGRAERTPTRKINEIFMAINLEAERTKTEIMELYLNIINLSCGCTGVGAASRYYFSKEPADLTLCECATIAAITNNPSYYNPKTHPENTRMRRDTVLFCMKEQGYISDAEYREAISTPIKLDIDTSMDTGNVYSWFTETVISDITKEFMARGYTREYAYGMILHGGLDIYTTVDPEVQNTLEKYYRDLPSELGEVRSSMIILDRYNGDILGIVGGTGKKQGNLIQSYASDTRRSPGSSIKPLSVYAPLIDSGDITWASIVEDSPVRLADGSEWPRNSNGKYLGDINVSYALSHSTNTVAVKLLQQLGEGRSFDILKNKLGMESLDTKGDTGLAALALGQLEHGISLRELTSAYTVFADGIYSRARSFYKVTDPAGNVIIDNRENQSAVFKRETADVMTQLLRLVVTEGTARGLNIDSSLEIAGKTGTTQNNCDRLFVGYTPSILAGVWCGNDMATPLPAELGNPSVCIFGDVINKIYCSDRFRGEPESFDMSDGVRLLPYSRSDGCISFDTEDDDAEFGWFCSE